MATKKERHPFALTIVPKPLLEEGPEYGRIRAFGPGRSPGSLPEGLPYTLPARLPDGSPPRSGNGSAAETPGAANRLQPVRPPRPRALGRGQRRLGVGRGQPGPFVREQGPILPPLESDFGPLGSPMSISEVARMIGCSPWSVRQTLIPQGLPHLRFKANGRLIFYRGQIARWIERQQQGGQTTK